MRRSITASDLALRGLWATRDALGLATIGRVIGGGFDGEMTVFNDRLAESNGRIRTTAAVEGEYALVLGSHREGAMGRLAVGDHVQITQALDLTDDIILRADLTLRTPEMPAGLGWQASLLLDDVVKVSTLGWPGRTRRVTDLAIPVSTLVGDHVFGIRLMLVETEA